MRKHGTIKPCMLPRCTDVTTLFYINRWVLLKAIGLTSLITAAKVCEMRVPILNSILVMSEIK
jgi:hypothetical protein